MKVYSDNLSCKCDIINLAINSIGFFMPQLDKNIFLRKRRESLSSSVMLYKLRMLHGIPRQRKMNLLVATLCKSYLMLRSSCTGVFSSSLQMLCKNQIKSPLLNQQLAAGAGERAGRGQERREFCSKCYKPSTINSNSIFRSICTFKYLKMTKFC